MNKLNSTLVQGVMKRGWVLTCLAAALCLAASPAMAQRAFEVTWTSVPAGPFEPGETLQVSFEISESVDGQEELTALGIEVSAPDGWEIPVTVIPGPPAQFPPQVTQSVGDPALQVAQPDPPADGSDNPFPILPPFSFFYNDAPNTVIDGAGTIEITATLQIPDNAPDGDVTLSAQLLYRFDGEEQAPAPVVSSAITVEAAGGVCGDANGNGSFNIFDALQVQQKLANLIPAITCPECADVTVPRNGTPSIFDALRMKQFLALLIAPPLCLE